MTRQNYLQLRRDSAVYAIIWYYFLEKSNSSIQYKQFVELLNTWIGRIFHQSLQSMQPMSQNDILNQIADLAISYYDKKFEVVILIVEKEVKKKVVSHYIF